MLRILAGLASLLLAGAVVAADVTVMPVGINFGPGHDREAISIANRSSEAVIIQVDTLAWTQQDGEDRYAPTRDLLVNPPVFSIAGGESQIVRVGLRNAPDRSRESAYRVVLRQVPNASPGDAQGVQVLLQLRLPIYVVPANMIRTAGWKARREADGQMAIELTNTGNVHQVIAGLALRPGDGPADAPAVAVLTTSTPVFPGQRHVWKLRPERPLSGKVLLEVTTDRGQQHVPLDPENR